MRLKILVLKDTDFDYHKSAACSGQLSVERKHLGIFLALHLLHVLLLGGMLIACM